LERHHEAVRTQLGRFRGKEVDTAGDGFFASFDGPAPAQLPARAIVETMPELGLEVRAGLHTGQCGVIDGKVAGSGIAFQDRGQHELKGIPGEWCLYAVAG
jgi:class 3 adenylate cyclase